MKLLRLWLLVLLTAVLSVRGAMAAAMLCLPDSHPTQEQVVIEHDHAAEQHVHGHEESAAAVDASAPAHDHGDAGQHSQCSLCASCCSSAPLQYTVPTIADLRLPAGAEFPDLGAPAPSFLSGGQDRPPRSI